MNKSDFLEKCKEFAKKYNDTWREYRYNYHNSNKNYKEPPDPNTYQFQCSWTSGGKSGGSCWDTSDSVYYSVSGEPEKELDALNEFLTAYFPSITFLQYKKFNKHIKTRSRTDTEYYGNETEYTGKYISFEDVYDTLCEIGLI